MKISIALLALLAWAFLSVPLYVGALTSNTWVNNLSSKGLTATITYDFPGDPQFINREVPAGQADHDQYDGMVCLLNPNGDYADPVNIEIWLDTSSQNQNMSVACDQSIVALDRPGTNSVDIFTSVYGDINTPDGNWVLILNP